MADIDSEKLQQKIETLRKIRRGWDAEALQEVASIEERLTKALLRAEYAEHDVTKMIVAECRGMISRISQELSENEELTEAKRHGLVQERKVWRWFMALLSRDYSAEIQRIEANLDFDIKNDRE